MSLLIVTTILLLLLQHMCVVEAEPIPVLGNSFSICTKTVTFTKVVTKTLPNNHYFTATTHTVFGTITKTVTSCPTTTSSCRPSAVQTHVLTYSLPDQPTGVPSPSLGLTFGSDWGYIACKTYCSSSCPNGIPTCDPSCSNKGSCGNSKTTNFYLGGLVANPASPQYWIAPTSPARWFTLFTLYFTSGDLATITAYDSITVEITGVSSTGALLPPLEVILAKPTQPPYWFAQTKIDLVSAEYGYVSRLDFLPYFTGTKGKGGQGPGGVVLASVKIDGNGSGAPVTGEAYTPLGC